MTSADLSYLESLNPAQREAVEYGGGPMLVIAGAGSGKTRVLTTRIIHLVKAHGARPWHVLAITFTNKAAQEMKERIVAGLGPTAMEMTIGTFHSACARILRVEIGRLGYGPRFTIFDEQDSGRLVAQCIDELGYDRKQYHPRAVKSIISSAKNEMLDENELARRSHSLISEVAAQVYPLYQERLKDNDAVDFDDLLLLTVNLFELYPDVLRRYRDRWRHVLVDEYQDTNVLQYKLVKMLAEEHRSLCVVGDDDQGIYSWRGADIRNILEFERDYPDARVCKLEQNYRSTPDILDAAGSVVKRNKGRKDKTLWTRNPPGARPLFYPAQNEHDEASMIAHEVNRRVEAGGTPSDAAVFYRTHAQSRVIEEELIKDGLPYRVFAGVRFYERREVKDIIAYLRLLANPKDEVSLRRVVNVPTRGIGATTVQRLDEYARSNEVTLFEAMKDAGEVNGLSNAAAKKVLTFVDLIGSLTEASMELDSSGLIEKVWTDTGYMEELEAERTFEAEARIDNLHELLNIASDLKEEYGAASLDEFLERVSLVNETDDLDQSAGYISLMTLHNAKGLEFPLVFMTGMEEGLFPHERSQQDEAQVEEERRLCYVGMTRAKETLYMSRAAVRTTFGAPRPTAPSRFLLEIPERYLEELKLEMFRPPEVEAGDYEIGETVSHDKWGPGVVVGLSGEAENRQVTVEFESVGRKDLLLSYAPLKKEDS